jgi:hypothetical protein
MDPLWLILIIPGSTVILVGIIYAIVAATNSEWAHHLYQTLILGKTYYQSDHGALAWYSRKNATRKGRTRKN